jgi:hypothetical protein
MYVVMYRECEAGRFRDWYFKRTVLVFQVPFFSAYFSLMQQATPEDGFSN